MYKGVSIIKRIGNLITEDKITVEFCESVILETIRRKKNRKSVTKILNHLKERSEELRAIVLNETFVASQYTYEIKREYNKNRKLTKVKIFPDQCIHHLLIMLIRNKIEKRIDPYAIASVPGRGQALGIKKISYWLQKEPHAKTISKYCGKGDIKKCFESVKPDVVMKMYRRIVKDEKYLRLMEKVVYSCDSLPLGNYCSAWALNLLLKDMDFAIRNHEAVHHYLRYMDDFIFLCSNKRKARTVRKTLEDELSKLNLKLKYKFNIFRVDIQGIDMIGYRFFRNYTILRRRNYRKILKKTIKMSKMKLYTVHDCQSIMSLLGQCRHCNSGYIWNVVGNKVNLHKVKEIISEDSRKRSKGADYIPSVILI